MRIAMDTNQVLSAFLWGGNPFKLLELARANQVVVLTSDELVDELEDVLSRAKFAKRFTALNLTPSQVLEDYRQLAELVQPVSIPPDAVRDPDDLIVLACAVGGQADYIVSGDGDLLDLEQFQKIPVITVAKCLELFSD